jgi:hypothetical protein
MSRKKLEITATDDEIRRLKEALGTGTPLLIALQYAGISQATYFYWVAMYSVVKETKNQEELEALGALECGVSIDQIKDITAASSPAKKTAMGAYIEPSAESLLQYKNNRRFKKFADQCYEIVKDCNEKRAEAAIGHIGTIIKSTEDKRINASGSMWFLERTLSDFFSKPSEKVKEEEINKVQVEKVQVEFIDPGTKENKDRIKDMEELILSEQKDPLVV